MHRKTLVANTTVFDGTQFIPDTSVVFDEEVILAVGTALDVGPDDRIVDGRGHTLLPGLIDAHVHIPSLLPSAERVLRNAVGFGVTTVIDLGADPTIVATMKARAVDSNDIADLRSAGVVATAPGGHPLELGGTLPTLERPEEAADFVAARVSEGSDFLKVIIEDGTTYGIESPYLDEAVVHALTHAAHASGLMVVAHAASQRFAQWAIQTKVDVLAHTVVDTPPATDVVAALAESGIAVISTLTVFEAAEAHRLWVDPRVESFMEAESLERLGEHVPPKHRPRTQVEYGLQTIQAYHQAGIPILAGTDAPNPGTASGASLHREFQLLRQAGMSATDILIAATSRPADVFGLHDRGRIAAGVRPDLVLVEGAVQDDIDETLSIRHVWKRGAEMERRRQDFLTES